MIMMRAGILEVIGKFYGNTSPLSRCIREQRRTQMERGEGGESEHNTTDIPDLSILERSVIRSIAQSDIGTSSGIARAVLSYHGEKHPLPFYLGELNDPAIRYRSREDEELNTVESALIIKPIPSSDWVSIDWEPDSTEVLQSQLLVFDIYGHELRRVNIYSNKPILFDVSRWTPGIYLASIYTDRFIQTKMFIVNE